MVEPGLITVSARLAAFAGALVACGLLVMAVVLWAYRRRMQRALDESLRKLSAARAELELAAITDALTGLYNRRFFDEVTKHHLEHHRRFHLPLSLGLSVGIVQVAADAGDLEQTIAQADERMYADKRRRTGNALGE
jgi:GGDEF domain-containing protein